MNPVIAFLLVFAAIGLLDKIFGNRFRYGEEFDKGIDLMGPMALSLVGICCIGICAAETNAEAISNFSNFLPFDASVIIGSLLAPDMGGLPVSLQIADSRELGIFSGVLLSATIGATICFQLPVCISGIREKNDVSIMMKGFIFGLAVAPVGILIGGIIIGLSAKELFINLLPIIVLSVVLALGFKISSNVTSSVLTLFGNLVRALSLVLFALVLLGLYVPVLSISSYELAAETFVAVGKMAVVVSGSMVFSKIALKVFKKPFKVLADLMKVNEYAVIGIMLSLTTTFAMLPLFSKMDTRGKVINAAFSVSGAYTLGGQMAYVSGFTNGNETLSFFVTKLLAGFLAIAVAAMVFSSKKVHES